MTELDIRTGVPKKYRPALELLACATVGNGGWHSFEIAAWGSGEYLWKRCGDVEGYVQAAHRWAECELRVSAVPCVDRGSFRLRGESSVLWARVETGKQYEELRKFTPEPTIVLNDGGVKHVALWCVEKPLEPEDCEKVNRHLAHKLGTAKKWAGTAFGFSPPGAVLREGRKRPVVVDVVSMSEESYPVGRIARRLPRQIPDPDAWRKAA